MKPHCRRPRFAVGCPGFTLVELLAVIAIIGVLAGILIPVTMTVRESARTVKCQGNLRHIYTALMLYLNDNKGTLPGPLTGAQPSRYSSSTTNSLAYHLAPYQGLQVDAVQRVNPYLLCPVHIDATSSQTTERSYAIPTASNMGYPFGYAQSSGSVQPKRYRDYTNQYRPGVYWAMRDGDRVIYPGNTSYAEEQSHKKGHNYLFFDGSVRLLGEAERTELQQQITGGGS